jgi:hypothetical protein
VSRQFIEAMVKIVVTFNRASDGQSRRFDDAIRYC